MSSPQHALHREVLFGKASGTATFLSGNTGVLGAEREVLVKSGSGKVRVVIVPCRATGKVHLPVRCIKPD